MMLETSETTSVAPEPPFICNQIMLQESRFLLYIGDMMLPPASFEEVAAILKVHFKGATYSILSI